MQLCWPFIMKKITVYLGLCCSAGGIFAFFVKVCHSGQDWYVMRKERVGFLEYTLYCCRLRQLYSFFFFWVDVYTLVYRWVYFSCLIKNTWNYTLKRLDFIYYNLFYVNFMHMSICILHFMSHSLSFYFIFSYFSFSTFFIFCSSFT